jgi:hypothetical protein
MTDTASDGINKMSEHDHGTTTDARGYLVLLLKEIARVGDPSDFLTVVEAIDWSTQRPDELIAAIDLALHLEMAALAARLAQLAAQLFPHTERLRRAARVLAPSEARPAHLPTVRGLNASRTWLREHADEYRGQWVAVREGQLVGVASSLEDLQAKISPHTALNELLVTHVL